MRKWYLSFYCHYLHQNIPLLCTFRPLDLSLTSFLVKLCHCFSQLCVFTSLSKFALVYRNGAKNHRNECIIVQIPRRHEFMLCLEA